MTDDPQTDTRWRVAVLVDGPRVAAWVATTIGSLEASPSVDFLGWSALARRPGRIGWAWRAYLRADALVFGGRAAALVSTTIDPAVQCLTAGRGLDDSRAVLRDAALDVLVDLRSEDGPAVRSVAHAGTWLIRHGSDRRPAGPLSYVTDVVAGSPAAPVVLIALGDEAAADRLVYRSMSSVSPISLRRTYDPASWKAAHFPIRSMRWLERDPAGFARLSGEAERDQDDRARPPTARFIPFLARISIRILRVAASRLARHEAWFVATRPSTDTPLPRDLRGFEAIAAPAGHFYADPFVLTSDGRTYLYVEDWLPETRRGAISVLELGPDGRPRGSPRRALERPYHLSYPFVFEHGGQAYLLPETSENGTVELYRATGLPDRWEPLGPIIHDIRALDPTVLEHAGRLWLFAGVAMPGASPWDELWLWSAPSIDGPWLEHPGNPIISDARSARPAGRILVRDSVLYRPSQDCAPTYGRRIVINRIDALSITEYREVPVATIEPGGIKGVQRTHCYDASPFVEVVDGRRARWRGRRA